MTDEGKPRKEQEIAIPEWREDAVHRGAAKGLLWAPWRPEFNDLEQREQFLEI